MRYRDSERFADHLRRRRGPEKLTTATRRRAGAATEVRRLLERHEPMRKTRSQRLHGAGIFAVRRRQRDTARHHDRRKVAQSGERDEHRGETLVARRDTEYAGALRKRTGEPAENHRGI